MKNNNFSLASRGLHYKLRISFYLMLILPFLILVYLVSSYILPRKGMETNIVLLIVVSIFIAVTGFLVIRDVIRRIVSISSEARLIASGDIDHYIYETEKDEVGNLGETVNLLTQRIRDNMEELKGYSEKTTAFNLEIQRRVVVLSSLLQISALISQGGKIDDILNLVVEKSGQIGDSDTAYLFVKDEQSDILQMKMVDGLDVAHLLNIKFDIARSIFEDSIKRHSPLVLDSKSSLPQGLQEEFYERFKLKNTLAIPIYSRGKLIGLLGIGNTREGFVYRKEDLDILDIFAKQVAIAIESDVLMHRVEKLEIKDALTGLYNEQFIHSRLEEEIKRAMTYHRPCAFILVNVDNFKTLYDKFGSRFAETALKKVATLIKDSVSEIDRVARFGDNEFAVLIPEKNKRNAIEIAENIRKKIEFSFSEEERDKRITVSGGVSENPLDGVSANELINKAKDLLSRAKDSGKNIIISE